MGRVNDIITARRNRRGVAGNDNVIAAVVSFARAMPRAEQAAVRVLLGAGPARLEAAGPRNLVAAPDLDAAIATQPVEVLRRLAKRWFSNAALRQHELNERDTCYRALAGVLPPARSGYAIAKAIRNKLRRYRDGPWRFDEI